MHPMLNIGIRAARAAGDIIVRSIDRIGDMPVNAKGRNDFVTHVDHQAESAIIEVIRKAYPQHAILAEESGMHGENEFKWLIDPLDGTTNFLHGFPQFAVSVALLHNGTPDQAVVYDPLRQELFTASRGVGAFLNNRRIRVSNTQHLDGSLLGTGFPFRDMDRINIYLEMFRAVCPLAAGIRRAGAAALDLAYVACGRLDGFWELGLKPWDMAGGALLITEAGGLVSDLDGGQGHVYGGDIVAANPRIHGKLLECLDGCR